MTLPDKDPHGYIKFWDIFRVILCGFLVGTVIVLLINELSN